MKTKILCLFLCAAVALSACGKSSNGMSNEAPITTEGYFEQNITPDEFLAEGLSLGQLSHFGNEKILYTALSKEGIPVAYISDMADINFVPLDNSLIKEMMQQKDSNTIAKATVSTDGTWWVALQTEEALLPSFLAAKADGVQSEIPLTVGDDTSLVYKIRGVQQDGSGLVGLLLASESETQPVMYLLVFDTTITKQIGEIRCPVGTSSVSLQDGKAYMVDFDGGLSVFDLKSTEKLSNKILPASMTGDLIKSSFCIDGSGAICNISGKGIKKIATEGEKVQEVVYDQKHAYTGAAFSQSSIVALTENRYIVSFSEVGITKLFLYKYGDFSSENTVSLHLWALNEQPIVREAVMQYQRAHPNVTITIEYGHASSDSAQTEEDIIKNLNTRLLADECPDILILDGLPIQGYMKSGLLIDLSNVVNQNTYYQNVIKCYQSDVGTVALPMLFRIPAIFTKAENGKELSAFNTLEDIAKIAQLNGSETFYFNNYEDMFRTFYKAYSPEIFPLGADVNEEKLRYFLEQTQRIASALNLSAEPTFRFGDNTPPAKNYIVPEQGVVGFQNGIKFGAALLNDYSDIYLSAHVIGKIVCKPIPGNSFVPYISMAVPSGSENIEEAKKFIQYALTDSAVQSSVFKGGFSVIKGNDASSYSAFLERALKDDAYPTPLDDNQAFQLDALINSLSAVSDNSLVLENKLLEQALRLYSGETSLDDAVAKTMRNVQLFLDEQQ